MYVKGEIKSEYGVQMWGEAGLDLHASTRDGGGARERNGVREAMEVLKDSDPDYEGKQGTNKDQTAREGDR